MTTQFNFANIAGQEALLEVNDRDTHMVIVWGDLTVTDVSGEVGFWRVFNSNRRGALAKGAAREAALRKHAREIIEAEIYEQLKFAQQELAAARG